MNKKKEKKKKEYFRHNVIQCVYNKLYLFATNINSVVKNMRIRRWKKKRKKRKINN